LDETNAKGRFPHRRIREPKKKARKILLGKKNLSGCASNADHLRPTSDPVNYENAISVSGSLDGGAISGTNQDFGGYDLKRGNPVKC